MVFAEPVEKHQYKYVKLNMSGSSLFMPKESEQKIEAENGLENDKKQLKLLDSAVL